jgi:hypothetical protein
MAAPPADWRAALLPTERSAVQTKLCGRAAAQRRLV